MFQQVVSDDDEQSSSDARIEEAVRIKFNNMVSKLAVLNHQQGGGSSTTRRQGLLGRAAGIDYSNLGS